MSSSASTELPRVHLLSNGRYTVMLSANGSGSSSWRDLAITRWREDPTRDDWGSHIVLRDDESGELWSLGRQPLLREADDYRCDFFAGGARIERSDGSLGSVLDIAVASDADAELRRLTLTNHGERTRTLTLTSYAELVLGSAAGDAGHPAFSKLFVQTEWIAPEQLLLATRRRRARNGAAIWAAHFIVVDAGQGDAASCETDRLRFLGRGRSLHTAQALQHADALSDTSGCVLDAVFSQRRHLQIAPGASVGLSLWTVVASSRDAVIAEAAKLRGRQAQPVLDDAARQAAQTHARFGFDAKQADTFARLVGPLRYASAAARASTELLAQGRGGAPVLWAAGISGDRPLLLLRIGAESDLAKVDELLRAQNYWRSIWFGVDVVVLNTAAQTHDALQTQLDARVQAQRAALKTDDGAVAEIFLLSERDSDENLRRGLLSFARWVMDASHGLAALSNVSADTVASAVAHVAEPLRGHASATATSAPAAPLEFENGIGGFDRAAREYVIRLDEGVCTPAPWINVVANPAFGFIVSAEGGGYSWSQNSQQNALTPWPNDPVSDSPHEILYLRDEDSGALWSATASPIRVPGASYVARHGKGYSRFAVAAHEIELDLLQLVAPSDTIKLSRLRIRNRSRQTRRLSLTAYVEWMLGPNGNVTAPFVVTSRDAQTGALFARNAWRAEYGERVAFIDLGGAAQTACGDRTAFLGHGGAVDRPAALADGQPLSGRLGAGIDPCGALQTRIELAADSELELVFLLGDADSEDAARALIRTWRGVDVEQIREQVSAQWNDLLDTVQVETPDRAMDLILNDWLLYQTLACRIWARTAYYQASGAYGFRDQLQDVMAVCLARPEVAREQLLRAAARQFVEGDVQHWWQPPLGQGIRTHMSDDRLWLAYVGVHYIEATADAAILDETVPFLSGEAIKPGDAEAFYQPQTASESASLYEHCARAIDISLTRGQHGLPLIGTGDWNDGMNQVGEEGRGESVWLGWFVLATIEAFTPHALARGEQARVDTWRSYADDVKQALDTAGWDGEWYRRGYYDDGTPLGSRERDACQIDAIAQSWSVMSGAADPLRAQQAMAAVDQRLLLRDAAIALLFTPPFDHTEQEPGYIKGYPPGIRENGGQYTHGSIWSIFAYAGLGQGDKAGELFGFFNPIRHSDSADAAARYRVEPYVACADVYSVAPHVGRGGWTWYSGSAGWLYRAGVEAILGLTRSGDRLRLQPCIPSAWPGYRLVYRWRDAQGAGTRYEITIENPERVSGGIASATLDAAPLASTTATTAFVPLRAGAPLRRVHIVLGQPSAGANDPRD
jgi:cyclic beta-1,2-glucan synthetase